VPLLTANSPTKSFENVIFTGSTAIVIHPFQRYIFSGLCQISFRSNNAAIR
jgi:hypothetical protein